MPAAPARASVDFATVRDRFNYEWAEGQTDFTDADTYWWYAVSIRVDPNEVIADDGEGNLWSVPFTTDGADAITFATPVRVRETFVPVAAADGAAATALVSRKRQRALASNLDRPEKPGRDNQAAAAGEPDNTEESKPMDANVLEDLAAEHGLDPATATEEQIVPLIIAKEAARVAAARANASAADDDDDAQPETPETTGDDPEKDDTAPSKTPAPDPIEQAATAALSDATTRLAKLEADAAARADKETRERRDGLASTWVREGRITPHEQTHYRGLLDVNEEKTVALAAALAPGRVPVDRTLGNPSAGETAGITATGWFPQLANKES